MLKLIKWAFILIVAAVIGLIALGGSVDEVEVDPAEHVDATPEAQERRAALLEQLAEQGVFYKVEKNAVFPHIYVGRAFYSLSIDDKKGFVNAAGVYHWVRDPEADIAVLKDWQSGKEIGKWTVAEGLVLD